MSSDAVNIVLDLSPDGQVLSFSVQKVISSEELTEINSSSHLPESCPTCTCRISVYARKIVPKLKTEDLSDQEDIPGKCSEEFRDPFENPTDEDEKPIVELFIDKTKEKTKTKRPPSKRSRKKGVHTKCLHCNKVFSRGNNLIQHQKRFGVVDGASEKVEGAVQCIDHCQRYFLNDEELQKHLKTAKKSDKTYNCVKCPEVFINDETYRRHLFSHGPAKCHRCKLELKDYKFYKKHMENHVKVRTHRCTVCSIALESEATLALHIRWAHKNDRACSFCRKTFNSLYHLRDHENGHKNITPHQCHHCGASFARQGTLLLHMEDHEGVAYICHFCGKSYKSKGYVRQHILTHHVKQGEFFICTHCPKRFTTKVSFNAHVMRHDAKTLPCPTCGRLFRTEHEVKHHINAMHTELTNRIKFKCEKCEKVLLSKGSFQIHMNTHQKVTEFKCRYCSKSMSSAHTLQRHEMIHTDERPFTCQTCGKGFRVATDLKVHTRLHTGEKPYECPLEECKKRFSDRGCFRGHLLNHEKQLNIKLIKKKNYLNE